MTTLATPTPPTPAVILVAPAGGGWRMSCDYEEALMFRTGGHAEGEARRLARCLAKMGQRGVIEIRDQTDAIVGVIPFRSIL